MLLSGGWMHPVAQAGARLADLVADHRFEVHLVEDPEEVAAAMSPSPELLVVDACWFSLGAERYTETERAEFGVGRSPAREQALEAFVTTGGAVLALHTAVICFDTWPRWGQLLGGSWNWATSSHPPPAEITVVPTTDGFGESFAVVDELYGGLDVAPSSTVVARARSGEPLAWVSGAHGGRVAVDLLGHDRRSFDSDGHLRLISALLGRLGPGTGAGAR